VPGAKSQGYEVVVEIPCHHEIISARDPAGNLINVDNFLIHRLLDQEAEMKIAEDINIKIGGTLFRIKTGATNFVYGADYLQFDFPKGRNGVNRAKIIYYPRGKYQMEFYKRGEEEAAGVVTDVCFNELEDVFTERTGLYTSL